MTAIQQLMFPEQQIDSINLKLVSTQKKIFKENNDLKKEVITLTAQMETLEWEFFNLREKVEKMLGINVFEE